MPQFQKNQFKEKHWLGHEVFKPKIITQLINTAEKICNPPHVIKQEIELIQKLNLSPKINKVQSYLTMEIKNKRQQVSEDNQNYLNLNRWKSNQPIETGIKKNNDNEKQNLQTESTLSSISTNTEQIIKDSEKETTIIFDNSNTNDIQSEDNQHNIDDPEPMPEKIPEDIPLCLLIGQAGNGKTFLMNKIFNTNQEMKLFEPQILWSKQIKYYFVDTSSFDFDSDYDQREEQIDDYKKLFKRFPNRIRSILVVINFERTDLMKKKALVILKYFNNLKKLISLAITNFHLSQNIESDKKHLKDNFKFLEAKDIIFVGKNTDQKEILKSLKQNSLQSLERSYIFDLRDSLFEDEDEVEQLQILSELEKRFNK
ncbi:unnamed protein product [Paramecium sonneborni]|uniref:Uncharacterized protein n=1 Tax=Paramecium sonneborni TaxID=65129 RepID=A0A8S1QXU9_9CILI|nr:unnamed protein product [Paramecium sonneborni]